MLDKFAFISIEINLNIIFQIIWIREGVIQNGDGIIIILKIVIQFNLKIEEVDGSKIENKFVII